MAENDSELEREQMEFERTKWTAESKLREKELEIKAAEQRTKDAELELKRQEIRRTAWSNPLAVAIFAAAVAAAGSAVVSILNARGQQSLDNQRSEATRILEMIKTGNVEAASANLQFLLDAGLIDSPGRKEKIEEYLKSRKPGTGPVLPATTPARIGPYGIVVSGDKANPQNDNDAAKFEVNELKKHGLHDVIVYDRQGFLRTVARFDDRTAAENKLPDIQSYRASAYIIDLTKWCPNAKDSGKEVGTAPLDTCLPE